MKTTNTNRTAAVIRSLARYLLFLFLLLSPRPALAQLAPTRGTPRFGTFDGGPDVINLANLNNHLVVPVFQKPGRALNFEFSLTYDSSFWLAPPFSGSSAWSPATNWGWGTGGTDIGTFTDVVSGPTNCIVSGRVVGTKTFWSNFVYSDGSGTPHTFYGSVEGDTSGCPSGGGTDSLTELAQDGSGYTLALTGDCCRPRIAKILIISPGGANISPSKNIQDTNGNLISTDGLGHLTDTLGLVALTTSGSSPSPVSYTYTDSTGHPAVVQVTYKAYTVQTNFGCSGISEYGPTANSLVDKISLPNGTFYQFAYELTPGSTTNVTGRLASVTLPTGSAISYVYTGGNHGIECTDGSIAGFTRTTPDGTWTYSRTQGSGIQSTTAITDPLGNQAVMQFLGIYQTVSQVYQGPAATGTLLQTNSTCYDGLTTNCTTINFGTPISQLSRTIQLGSAGPIVKHVSFYDGGPGTLNTGVQTEQDDYDYGSGGPGPLVKKTLYAYGCTSSNLRIASVIVQNGSGTQISKVTYNYDETTPVATSGLPQHGPVFAPRCNLTSQSDWLNTTGAQITSHKTYFDTGMVNTASDPLNHSTTYAYSSTFAAAYPTTITNALTQSVTYNFDANTGLPVSTTDLNGKTTTYSYDNMLRATQVSYPDSGQTTNCFTDSGGASCTQSSAPFRVVATRAITAGLNESSTSVLDGFGRPIQTQLTSDPAGTTYTATAYDGLGRVNKNYNPTRCNPPTTNCGESTWGYSTQAYDALGRVTSLTAQDNLATTTSHTGNCTTVTDPAGKSRKSCVDGLGRLTQVFEDPSGLNYETDYTYDALDNLLTVKQKGGDPNSADWRARSFTYDSLSRLLTAANPESGTFTYTYDNGGNLVTKTSPAPNQTGSSTVTVAYCYDTLNRSTSKAYTTSTTCPQTSPVATYLYDQTSYNGLTITNGLGHRTGMTDAAGAEAWSYDAMGRPLTDQRTTNGVTKPTAYTYNLDGSMATLTYPSSRAITYTLQSSGTNTAGRFLSAVDTANSINYATAASYAPGGGLLSLTNGASLLSSLYYNSRFQPCRISAKFSGTAPTSCTDSANIGNVLDFTYNFSLGASDNGNVTGVTNNRDNTRSQSFTYDSLNRILSAKTSSTSGANCWDEQFGYDPWGNFLSIGRISGYICSNEELLSVAATTKNQVSGYTYDSAGNLINDNAGHTYTYSAENQLVTAGGVTYAYDGDGKRAQKSGGKLYWYGMGSDPLDETDLSGNSNNATFAEYIFFNSQRIARRDYLNNVNYYFSDHLGTARVVANASGSVLDDSDFYPFGGERIVSSSSGNRYKFTGKERDFESGLDNFEARYNSSSLGRFMSPDPENVGASLGAPQSWNAYSYVLNNPLNSVDPTGLDCIYVDNNTGKQTGFNRGDCDNSTEEKANSGYYVDGAVNRSSIQTEGNWIAYTYTPDGPSLNNFGAQCWGDCPNGAVQVSASIWNTPKIDPDIIKYGDKYNAWVIKHLSPPAMVISGFTGLDPAFCGGPLLDNSELSDADHAPEQTEKEKELNEGKQVKRSTDDHGNPIKKRPGPAPKGNQSGPDLAGTVGAAAEAMGLVNNGINCIANSRK